MRSPRYFNWKGPQGLETVDEFTREPGQKWMEFRAYLREMVREYHLAGQAVYISSRACKDWNNKPSQSCRRPMK